MDRKFINYFVCLLYFIEVNSMALKGPPLTRYDPCGLGIIYFDKVADRFWIGVVNFGLYSNVVEAEMEIYFDKEVVIYGASQTTKYSIRRNNWRHFVIRPRGQVSPIYIFYLQTRNISTDEDDTPVVSQFIINNVSLCNNDVKASHTINSLNVTSEFPGGAYAQVCGRRSLDHTELVSVRTEAKAGDWPWHVALLIKINATNVASYDCGGTIISRTAIITAGHCVYKQNGLLEPQKILVVAGVNDYKDLLQTGRQQRTPTEIVLHPNYQDEYATADLAIIKVNNFVYTEFVQPICIWGPVYDKTDLFGREATVVGFGKTEDDKLSQTLRAAYTLVQNDTTCINWAPNLYRKLINEFTFCAGYGPKSSPGCTFAYPSGDRDVMFIKFTPCDRNNPPTGVLYSTPTGLLQALHNFSQKCFTGAVNPRNGDSGGGLVVRTIQADHKISWFLRGVLSKCGVSAGKLCDPTYYVVYTDVGPHYGWIYHHSGLQFTNNVQTE